MIRLIIEHLLEHAKNTPESRSSMFFITMDNWVDYDWNSSIEDKTHAREKKNPHYYGTRITVSMVQMPCVIFITYPLSNCAVHFLSSKSERIQYNFLTEHNVCWPRNPCILKWPNNTMKNNRRLSRQWSECKLISPSFLWMFICKRFFK